MKIKAPPLSKRMRLFIVCVLMIVSFNSIPYISAVGNDNQPKYILMRLEDVGPGGQYEGPEQLGKLRAVMELLKEYKVRYQMAVIPRWIDIAKDGKRYDVSLDKSDDPYVESFVNLLKQAESSGAVIGMHGYTHQVGDVRRADGQHESGIGNEFNVLDVEETNSPKYAQKRVEEAKQIFDGINIHPKFWEAPHYQTTPEQDEVFRCYFGLLYQADMHKDRNTVTTQYAPARNTRVGETSLGAVNVPTPLSYIPYNRDADIILNQLDKADRLPSFFFHPFLEFKHLIPVLDSDGDPVIQDGIPLYKYPAKAKSILQKLLIQLEQKEYKFIPITDFIPFSPAKSVPLEEVSDRNVQLADVTGDGQADVVRWDAKLGEIRVKAGEFKGYRNEPVGDAKTWATIPYHTGDVWTLFDHNGDGRNDLWILRADGQWMSYHSNGSAFVAAGSYKFGSAGWSDLYAINQGKEGWVLAGQSQDKSQLEAVSIKGESARPLPPLVWKMKPSQLTTGDLDGNGKEELIIPFARSTRWIQLSPDPAALKWNTSAIALELPVTDNGTVRIGDYNGDGKQDILFWNRVQQSFAVYEQIGPLKFEYLSRMGPWGPRKGKLMVSDLNGDGRKDVAIANGEEAYLDTALSYESADFLTSAPR